MDDSLLYTSPWPIQSKSLQYIFTEPTQFTAPQVGAENVANRDFIVEDKPKEIPKQTSILGFDIDGLRSGLLQREMLKGMYPDLQKAQDVTELPTNSTDPWSFTYKGYNFDKLMKHEQGYDRKTGRMIAPLKSYYNGSGVNRIRLWGPGITSNTWKDYNLANGSKITLDQIDQMSDQDRFNLFKKFGSWYVDNLEKAYSPYGISGLSADLKKSILDASWEYGINSPMVKNMIYLMTGNAIKGMNPKITWDMMTDPGYVGKFFPKYPFEVKPAVGRMKEARKYYEASRRV